jgi:hypothetical protein
LESQVINMKPKNNKNPITQLPLPASLIERRIYIIRGQEVMLDSDLAELYQVATKALNQAVRRNIFRFPKDFMFQLSPDETENLKSQFVTSSLGISGRLTDNRSQIVTGSQKHRDPRLRPFAFTEHGVAMLTSVLKSKRAILMNIFIIRAFIQLRHMLAQHKQLSKRLQKVEGIIKLHDEVLLDFVEDIKRLKNPIKINAIGFQWKPKTKI